MEFRARIQKQDQNTTGAVACVFLPRDIADHLAQEGIKRILVHTQGQVFKRAAISDGQGGRYIMTGKDVLQKLGCGIGHMLDIRIEVDPDPDAVDLPEELEVVLEQDEEFAKYFFGITKGRQRSYAYFVTTAKTMDTRIKRSLELAYKAKTGQLDAQRRNAQKAKE